MSRSPSKGPLGALLAFCALALATALVVSTLHSSRPPSGVNPSTPLVVNPEHGASTKPAEERSAEAQTVARRFLASYLPVLYGRRTVSTIVGADQHVLASLASASRTPPPPPSRRPRVTALAASPQNDGSVLEIATINDGITSAYRIVFTVAEQAGVWRVTQLANY